MSSGSCSRGRGLATHLWLEIHLRELSDLMLRKSLIERHDAVLTLLGPHREDSLAPFLAQLGSTRAEQSLPFLVDDDDLRFGDGDAVEECGGREPGVDGERASSQGGGAPPTRQTQGRGGREPGVDGGGDSAEEMARPPAAQAQVRSGDGGAITLKPGPT